MSRPAADSNAHWQARDLAHLWHPCTQMKDHEQLPPIPIRSASGVWLEDYDGKRYLDAVSSWWVNLFGHANPVIAEAVSRQCATLEQMSYHFWLNQGRPGKQRFAALGNGYHGETLAALAVGDVPLYKQTYAPLLMDAHIVPSPDCYLRQDGEEWESHSLKMVSALEDCLANHADSLCALILEPLVQCAGGMRMYHPAYLQRARELCDAHDVHLIADDIAVGFGRTGSLFACEQAGITPDFMCLSKGLTGGFLPLSTVVTTDQIHNAFYDDYNTQRAFLHSHSFTGNPLGCAAALATIGLLEDGSVLTRNADTAACMRAAVAPLEHHPHVAEIRQTGMILAIEMTPNGTRHSSYDWRERRGMQVYRYALQQGVLLRPLGNVVYFMPPYVISKQEVQIMAQAAIEGIEIATGKGC